MSNTLVPAYNWTLLDEASGVRLRVSGRGLLLGRDPSCDVVVADHRTSRVHALVHERAEGLELAALGRTVLGSTT